MQTDGKMQRLALMCGRPPPGDDMLVVSRLVELTEFAAGSVVFPAGLAGRWRTRVVKGSVATTSPPVRHVEGAVLAHGPETALLAATDVVLLTVADRDIDAVTSLAPGLMAAASTHHVDAHTGRRSPGPRHLTGRPAPATSPQAG